MILKMYVSLAQATWDTRSPCIALLMVTKWFVRTLFRRFWKSGKVRGKLSVRPRKKGKLTEEAANKVRANISFTGDLKTAAGNADLVIEAVLERIDLKRKIFADLDKIAPAHAILATNSSYIVSSEIASATSRPAKVVNLHFFNPALVMKLVEVVQGPHVSDETAQILMAFCRKIEKEPIHVKKKSTDLFSTVSLPRSSEKPNGCWKWVLRPSKISIRLVFLAPATRWVHSNCWI